MGVFFRNEPIFVVLFVDSNRWAVGALWKLDRRAAGWFGRRLESAISRIRSQFGSERRRTGIGCGKDVDNGSRGTGEVTSARQLSTFLTKFECIVIIEISGMFFFLSSMYTR